MAKRYSPRTILLSIRENARLTAPEPKILQTIGAESKRKGTDKLSDRQIEQVIKAARRSKKNNDSQRS